MALDLNRLGLGLQAFDAGLRGRGQEFEAREQMMQQGLSEERKKAAAEDAFKMLRLVKQGRLADALNLTTDRERRIRELGGNPFETSQMTELTTQAVMGDNKALSDLESNLQEDVMAAQSLGYLPDPRQDLTAGERSFMAMTEGLSEEDRERARRINLGLEPREVGASAKVTDIGGVPHVFDPVSRTMVPVQVAGEQVTAETVGASEASIAEAEERGKGAGKLASDTIKDANNQISLISRNVRNIDRAINALDKGAKTGAIERFLPSVREGSVLLEQVRRDLGLDVIGSVTFGALSEGELNLALDTAIPTGLDEGALRDWLNDKREAQNKLVDYLDDQIDFLAKGGTIPEWRAKQREEAREDITEETDWIVDEATGQLIRNPRKQ